MITLYVRFFVTPWTVVHQAPVFHYLPEFAQTHVHWVSDSIQSSHPLSPPSPPALSLSQHQSLFQWDCSLNHGPEYWNFSFCISPSNEYSGLISFGIDCLILLLCKGLSRVLQHHSLKASILQCSVFIMVQLSHHDYWENHSFDYMDLCWQSDVCAFEFAV